MRIPLYYMVIGIQKCTADNIFLSSYVPFTETIIQFRYIMLITYSLNKISVEKLSKQTF